MTIIAEPIRAVDFERSEQDMSAIRRFAGHVATRAHAFREEISARLADSGRVETALVVASANSARAFEDAVKGRPSLVRK